MVMSDKKVCIKFLYDDQQQQHSETGQYSTNDKWVLIEEPLIIGATFPTISNKGITHLALRNKPATF